MADIPNQNTVRNRLLQAMDADDFHRIAPHLVPEVLPIRHVLIEPGCPVPSIYFPESGVVSIVSALSVETEVGMVGRDGFVGLMTLFALERTPLKAYVQIASTGFSMALPEFKAALVSNPSLGTLLGRYAHAFMIQAASTTYASSHFTVEQRLARWLLMAHDRSDCDDLALTHELLAVMLCVRRPGVTVATHVLEGNGLIRAKRGRITILADLASDSYGLAEAEYERMNQAAHRGRGAASRCLD